MTENGILKMGSESEACFVINFDIYFNKEN